MAGRDGNGLVLAWLLAGLIVIEIIGILLFVPASAVSAYNTAERKAVAGEVGVQTEASVANTANTWYRVTLVNTGLVAALNTFIIAEDSPDALNSYSFTMYIRDRLKAFWRILYALYYRASVIWLWLPYLLPIALPTLIDAFQERRVRQWRFSHVSPMARTAAGRVRTVGIVLLIGALLAPFHIPVLAYPIIFGVLMLANWTWVANLQKRL